MNENNPEKIKASEREIKDLKRQLEEEKKENKRLRDQPPASSNEMKPSVKRALAEAGPEADGSE